MAMTIVVVGIDLAKNGFAPHGVDEAGKAALVRPAARPQNPDNLGTGTSGDTPCASAASRSATSAR